MSSLVAISSTTSTFVTTWALALAGSAVVALLLIDRLKPSRPARQAARAERRGEPLAPVAVVEDTTAIYKRTPVWKRFFAFTGVGVLSLVLGAMLAMLLAVVVVAALTLLAGLS